MNGLRRAGVSVGFALLVLVACGREEESGAAGRTPIVETRLKTPRAATRVGAALSAHTPKPGKEKLGKETAAKDEPKESAEPKAAPKEVAKAAPAKTEPVAPAEEPKDEPAGKTVELDEPNAEPTAAVAEKPAPVAEPTPIRIARRAVASRGTELAASPSGSVLGEFQGRTDVEVLEDREGWSRVRTQVIDGGTIEGWVETTRLADPAAKAAAKPASAEKKTEVASAPAADGSAKAPAAKPAAAPKAASAKKPAGNGPDNVNLEPIAGTAKKRPATPFTHKAHWEDYSIKCETCHHPVKAKGGAVPSYSCSSSGCHTASECNNATVEKKNKACPNFEDAYHTQCIDCHKKDGGPTKCAECHTG
jgi:hypothetical protein